MPRNKRQGIEKSQESLILSRMAACDPYRQGEILVHFNFKPAVISSLSSTRDSSMNYVYAKAQRQAKGAAFSNKNTPPGLSSFLEHLVSTPQFFLTVHKDSKQITQARL